MLLLCTESLIDSVPGRCRDEHELQGDAPMAAATGEEAECTTQQAAAGSVPVASSPRPAVACSRDSSQAAANQAAIGSGPAQPSIKRSRELGWVEDRHGDSGVQQDGRGSNQLETAARSNRLPVARRTVRRSGHVIMRVLSRHGELLCRDETSLCHVRRHPRSSAACARCPACRWEAVRSQGDPRPTASGHRGRLGASGEMGRGKRCRPAAPCSCILGR